LLNITKRASLGEIILLYVRLRHCGKTEAGPDQRKNPPPKQDRPEGDDRLHYPSGVETPIRPPGMRRYWKLSNKTTAVAASICGFSYGRWAQDDF
jgi:hypothetical protein